MIDTEPPQIQIDPVITYNDTGFVMALVTQNGEYNLEVAANNGNGRPSYALVHDYPSVGGYPLGSLLIGGIVYRHQGRGLFLPQDASPAEVSAMYDRWAVNYSEQVPWTYEVGQNTFAILGESGYQPGGRILDIGCGTGNTSAGMVRSGVDASCITGVDISPEMLAVAQKSAEGASELHGVSLHQGNIIDWQPPKAGERFAAAVSALALHHIPPELRLRAFNNIHDLLIPKGLCTVVVSDKYREGLEMAGFIRRLSQGRVREDVHIHQGINGYDFELRYLTVQGENLLATSDI